MVDSAPDPSSSPSVDQVEGLIVKQMIRLMHEGTSADAMRRSLPQDQQEILDSVMDFDRVATIDRNEFAAQLAELAHVCGRHLASVRDYTAIAPSVAKRSHALPFLRSLDSAVKHWDQMGEQMRYFIGLGIRSASPSLRNTTFVWDRPHAIHRALEEIRSATEFMLSTLESGYRIASGPQSDAETKAYAVEAILTTYVEMIRKKKKREPSLGADSPARMIGAVFFAALLDAAGDKICVSECEDEPYGFGVAWKRAVRGFRLRDRS